MMYPGTVRACFAELEKLAWPWSVVPKGGISRHDYPGPDGKPRLKNFARWDETAAELKATKDPTVRARLRKKLEAIEAEPL